MTELVADYKRRSDSIRAAQYDGRAITAYKILAWVIENGGRGFYQSGYEDQGPDQLYIQGVEGAVLPSWWIVMEEFGRFVVYTDPDFQKMYEPSTPGVAHV